MHGSNAMFSGADENSPRENLLPHQNSSSITESNALVSLFGKQKAQHCSKSRQYFQASKIHLISCLSIQLFLQLWNKNTNSSSKTLNSASVWIIWQLFMEWWKENEGFLPKLKWWPICRDAAFKNNFFSRRIEVIWIFLLSTTRPDPLNLSKEWGR